jgi:CDGSH-type Zn-finger protein
MPRKASFMSDSTDSAAPVKITVTENGWYLVEGDVEIVASDGSTIREGSKFFLCRCGQSKVKPFCDSSHKECGFTDDGLGRRKSAEQ